MTERSKQVVEESRQAENMSRPKPSEVNHSILINAFNYFRSMATWFVWIQIAMQRTLGVYVFVFHRANNKYR